MYPIFYLLKVDYNYHALVLSEPAECSAPLKNGWLPKILLMEEILHHLTVPKVLGIAIVQGP